jgi:LPPG:FO 2-phospho-L-lactate transferase
VTIGSAVFALSGGVGGAKLVCGLARVLTPGALTVVCNTGDDFEQLGLVVCPDVDSVTYALAGLDDRERGWGRSGETWHFLEALGSYTDATWFRLGDRDLAMHVWRTAELRRGRRLSEVARDAAQRLGIQARLEPMSDASVRTLVHCDTGALAFQEYFVRQKALPRVRRLEYVGADGALPGPAAARMREAPQPRAVVLCPSNPWLSIDPILAIAGWRHALEATAAPVVAVSPIVAGRALKGPAAKIMAELGVEVSPLGIARHYGALLDGIVIDALDRAHSAAIEALGIRCLVTETVMLSDDDRVALARATLAFADDIR